MVTSDAPWCSYTLPAICCVCAGLYRLGLLDGLDEPPAHVVTLRVVTVEGVSEFRHAFCEAHTQQAQRQNGEASSTDSIGFVVSVEPLEESQIG